MMRKVNKELKIKKRIGKEEIVVTVLDAEELFENIFEENFLRFQNELNHIYTCDDSFKIEFEEDFEKVRDVLKFELQDFNVYTKKNMHLIFLAVTRWIEREMEKAERHFSYQEKRKIITGNQVAVKNIKKQISQKLVSQSVGNKFIKSLEAQIDSLKSTKIVDNSNNTISTKADEAIYQMARILSDGKKITRSSVLNSIAHILNKLYSNHKKPTEQSLRTALSRHLKKISK